jgi:hypothetical protein
MFRWSETLGVEFFRVSLTLLSLGCCLTPSVTLAQQGASSVGEVYRGITINRLEGQNDHLGETHVKYLSPASLKEDDRKRAEKYRWTEDRIKAEEANIDRFSPGGVIQVDILRATEAAANTSKFTVVVLDKDGKELMRKPLPAESHLTHHPHFFGAMAMCTINRKMEGSFFVVVIDHQQEKEYKFQIIQ